MPANEEQNQEKALFEAALELPTASERTAFLKSACGDEAALRERIEALLRAHVGEKGFLPDSSPQPPAVLRPLTEKPGDCIGRYKLLQQIGEGGCGVVFMAEQETPVRRRVALKVIKLGMDTRQVVARFEAERQALALMDHPNIAKVLDAGATDTGRPYFVMELVRGGRLTEFCDENHLSMRQRLDLFVHVCHAVQHAHQKGIIHRDLKPSNILVTVNDPAAAGCPKVIDFGIAKAITGQQLTDKTLFTAFEQFMGTPAYMSPEQAVMTSLDIDTRSDIYSLGVLLYELLTGKTPFDAKELWEAGVDEMRRTIREVEPVKPSTRLTLELVGDDVRRLNHSSTRGESSGAKPRASSRRLLQVKELIPALRGDLDWIVMKALEKDRARRYETASGFAADIQRHLRNEPVMAGPPSRIYRMRKLVRRHRLAFAAGTIVLAGLVIGLAVASWGLRRERLARTRAEAAERSTEIGAKKSQQVSRILRNMLAGAAPEVARGRDTTVLREMLDATAANVERDTRDHPEVEADVRATLGSVYDALGEYAKAEAQLRLALTLRKTVFGEEHLEIAESLHLFGASLYHQRRASEAEPLFRQALALRVKLLGPENLKVAESMNNLARALNLLARTNEATSLQRDALALQVKLLGSNHIEVAISVHNLGNDLVRQRQYAEAETHLRWALGVFQQTHGTNHPDVASAQHDLASALYKQGRNAEAETLFRDALRLKKELYGPDHAEVAATLRNLASLLRRSGRLAEAEESFREALTRARRGGVFSSRDLEECLYNTGSVALDRAWAEFESTPPYAHSQVDLAARGREAETLLRECLSLHAQTAGTNDAPSANVRSHLGAALTLVAVTDDSLAPGRETALAGAESLLLAAHTRLQVSTSTTPELKRKAVLHLARLYQAWGKPEKAEQWQAKLREQRELP